MLRRISSLFVSPGSPVPGATSGAASLPPQAPTDGDATVASPTTTAKRTESLAIVSGATSSSAPLATSHDSGVASSYRKSPVLAPDNNDAITDNDHPHKSMEQAQQRRESKTRGDINTDDWVVISDSEDEERAAHGEDDDGLDFHVDSNSAVTSCETASLSGPLINDVPLMPTLAARQQQETIKQSGKNRRNGTNNVAKNRRLALAERLETLATSDYIVSTANGAVASLTSPPTQPAITANKRDKNNRVASSSKTEKQSSKQAAPTQKVAKSEETSKLDSKAIINAIDEAILSAEFKKQTDLKKSKEYKSLLAEQSRNQNRNQRVRS